tara:strand:- start:90 stop:302 length:213 start_codon:yes stop_codon:yes gene_type:complete
MHSSKLIKDLNELREVWRKNDFQFTSEQQAEFDRLKELRRERVKYFHDNDLVFKAGAVKKEKVVVTKEET